jgi:hypothetical protein
MFSALTYKVRLRWYYCWTTVLQATITRSVSQLLLWTFSFYIVALGNALLQCRLVKVCFGAISGQCQRDFPSMKHLDSRSGLNFKLNNSSVTSHISPTLSLRFFGIDFKALHWSKKNSKKSRKFKSHLYQLGHSKQKDMQTMTKKMF